MAKLGPKLDLHKDAVGVAVVVDGQIKEIDLYPGHTLLAKVYPRLLRSYAVEAAVNREQARQKAEADKKKNELGNGDADGEGDAKPEADKQEAKSIKWPATQQILSFMTQKRKVKVKRSEKYGGDNSLRSIQYQSDLKERIS